MFTKSSSDVKGRNLTVDQYNVGESFVRKTKIIKKYNFGINGWSRTDRLKMLMAF